MSFPPNVPQTEVTLANMMDSALAGRLQVWILRDGLSPLLVFTTVVTHDTISDVCTLFVYSLGALAPVPREAWHEGLSKLKEVAARAGCTHVLSRTNNSRLVQLLKSMGASTDVHMVNLEV